MTEVLEYRFFVNVAQEAWSGDRKILSTESGLKSGKSDYYYTRWARSLQKFCHDNPTKKKSQIPEF